MLTLTSEHPHSEDYFERNSKDKIYPSDKRFEKNHYEMKSINEHIAAMLTKLHDKYDKNIEKQLQPMSIQIIELSSKQSEKI